MRSCRLCFELDARMYNFTDEKLRTFMGLILKSCGYQNELMEKHFVCFECRALLVRMYQFVQKTIRAQEFLKEIQTQKSVQLKTYNVLRDKYHLNSSLSHHKVKVDFTFKVTDPYTDSDTDSKTDSCTEGSKSGVSVTLINTKHEDSNTDNFTPSIEVEVNSFKKDKKLFNELLDPFAGQTEETPVSIKVENSDIEDNFVESGIICETEENDNNPEEYEDPLVVPNYKNKMDVIGNENQVSVFENQIVDDFVVKKESNLEIIEKNVIAEDSNSAESLWLPEEIEKKPKKKKKSNRRHTYVVHNSSSEDEAERRKVANKKRIRIRPKGVIISTDNILSSTTRKKNINFKKIIGAYDSDRDGKKVKDSDAEYNPNIEESVSESSDSDGEYSYDESGKKIKKKIPYPRDCCYCDMEMASAKEYFYHTLSFHPNEKYEFAGKKRFVCQHCGKHKSRYQHLVDHEKTHLGNPTMKCPKCPKKFYIKSRLLLHIKNVHAPPTYFCDYCNKASATKSDLKLHIRTHTGEKPFKCHICGMGFAHLGNVSIHIRTKHTHEPTASKQTNTSRQTRKRRRSSTTDSEQPPVLNKRKKKKTKNGKKINKKKSATELTNDKSEDMTQRSNCKEGNTEKKCDNEDDMPQESTLKENTIEQNSDLDDKPLSLRRKKKVINGKDKKKKTKIVKKIKEKSTEKNSDKVEDVQQNSLNGKDKKKKTKLVKKVKEKSTEKNSDTVDVQQNSICKESTSDQNNEKEEQNSIGRESTSDQKNQKNVNEEFDKEKNKKQNNESEMPQQSCEEEWLTYFQL